MASHSTNPLMQIIAIAAGVLLFMAALFVGAVVFLIILGLAVLGGVIMSLRLWWMRRRLQKTRHHHRHAHRARGVTIEGEVVRKERGRDDGP